MKICNGKRKESAITVLRPLWDANVKSEQNVSLLEVLREKEPLETPDQSRRKTKNHSYVH